MWLATLRWISVALYIIIIYVFTMYCGVCVWMLSCYIIAIYSRELKFVNCFVDVVNDSFECAKTIHRGYIPVACVEVLIVWDQGPLICMWVPDWSTPLKIPKILSKPGGQNQELDGSMLIKFECSLGQWKQSDSLNCTHNNYYCMPKRLRF